MLGFICSGKREKDRKNIIWTQQSKQSSNQFTFNMVTAVKHSILIWYDELLSLDLVKDESWNEKYHLTLFYHIPGHSS